MTNVDILGAARDQRGGYKVDVTRGERIARVSSEWFSRPADERYLSLSELFAAVRGRAERCRTRTAESDIRPRTSCRRAADRRKRHCRYALEGARCARLVDRYL